MFTATVPGFFLRRSHYFTFSQNPTILFPNTPSVNFFHNIFSKEIRIIFHPMNSPSTIHKFSSNILFWASNNSKICWNFSHQRNIFYLNHKHFGQEVHKAHTVYSWQYYYPLTSRPLPCQIKQVFIFININIINYVSKKMWLILHRQVKTTPSPPLRFSPPPPVKEANIQFFTVINYSRLKSLKKCVCLI